MPKRIEVTDKMRPHLEKVLGADADFGNVAVFEATAVTSLPLNKRGTLFEGGRVTSGTRSPSLDEISPWADGVSLFWHLVDVVWLGLFTTIWIIR